jgi:hypothetical protein
MIQTFRGRSGVPVTHTINRGFQPARRSAIAIPQRRNPAAHGFRDIRPTPSGDGVARRFRIGEEHVFGPHYGPDMNMVPSGLGFSLKPPKFIRKAASAIKRNVTLKRALVAGAVVGAAFIPGVAPAALAIAKGAVRAVVGAGKGLVNAVGAAERSAVNLFKPKPCAENVIGYDANGYAIFDGSCGNQSSPAPTGQPSGGGGGSTGDGTPPAPGATGYPSGGGGGGSPAGGDGSDTGASAPAAAGLGGPGIVPIAIGLGLLAMAMNQPRARRARRRNPRRRRAS